MNIVNKYDNKRAESPKDVYIGRPSVLGNPFVIGRDGTRDQVIALYRRWLGNKVRVEKDAAVLAALRAIPADANLVCFCAPLRCHGEVIRDACRWLDALVDRTPCLQGARVSEMVTLWRALDASPREVEAMALRRDFDDLSQERFAALVRGMPAPLVSVLWRLGELDEDESPSLWAEEEYARCVLDADEREWLESQGQLCLL